MVMIWQVVGEISNLFFVLHQKRGTEFLTFLRTSLLPSLKSPADVTEKIIQAISTCVE